MSEPEGTPAIGEPGAASAGATVLVIDDEEPIRFLCVDLLKSMNFRVLTAADGESGLRVLEAEPDVDVVVCDVRMPGIDGIETTRRIHERFPGTDVIVLTGYGSIDVAVEAMKNGAADFLRKPFKLDALLRSIDAVCEKRSLRQHLAGGAGEGRGDALLEEKLAEFDRLKDEFLSITSHELLTPLTPISGYLETLRDGALGELTSDQREAIDTIYGEIDKLRVHIRNLLSIRNLQGGCLELHMAEVDLREVAAEAVRQVASAALERCVAIRTRDAGETMVTTDPEHLAAVLVELLRNAVKFSRPEGGEVALSIGRDGDRVAVTVTDDGIGIAPENLPRIFDKFYQAQRGDARSHEGIGIGLTVARGVVDALGGTIRVESTPGTGTSVTVELPA